jgi:autotransporter passenger strand-loop-strand repeat protein
VTSDTTVWGGTEFVNNDGTASDTTILAGGVMDVEFINLGHGGTAVAPTIAGGYVDVVAGAYLIGLVPPSGSYDSALREGTKVV